MPAIQYLGGRTALILSGKIPADTWVAAIRRGGRVVECTGLENRHRSNSVASSNLALSASREFDKIAGSDFGRAQRARRARAGTARVNLTLSAICASKIGPVLGSDFDCAEQGAWTNSPEFDQIAGSDLGRRSALATAREARGPGGARVHLALSASRNAPLG